MKKLFIGVALAALISGCSELTDTETSQSGLIQPWRAATILGGGDGNAQARRQGVVASGQLVEAGQGTIYPGRQPLFRDSDFVNENGERTVSLNLVDVSVQEAAQAILGELLNENYVLDPGVAGTVNIRSTRPISRTTAIEVFELALRQNNAALIRRGEVFAITPLSGDLSIGASTAREVLPGYTLRVIPLENIGAQEMAAILQPFAGNGIVGIDAQRNIIVLAGSSVDHRAWQKTIDSFDVDWLANRSVGIFPIKGRSAQSIVAGLELVVETDENFEPLVVFQTIPENNSVLAVAKTPSALKNVSNCINRLTLEGANDAQVYSYDMKFARASDVAPTLAQILGIEVSTSESMSDDPAVAEAQLLQASATATGGDVNATRIVASEATNTLLIHATQNEYQRVLGMLHRLDVPPRQVLVEANIVEVTLTNELRYGVQYFFESGNSSISLDRDSVAGIAAQTPGFSAIFDEAPRVVIDALDDVTSVNVVSSPNLMILNNQSARLVVGDQVPVATQQAQDGDAADEAFVSTIEFRDTGVIFEVTPRINSSGSVVLDITQEISSVGADDGDTLTPTISQRVISSSVAVDSGETIAMGGLFSTNQTRGQSGIPGLRKIPLFGRTSNTDTQTELLVLITPRIVNDQMDARRVTRQLRERVEQLKLDDASLSTQVRAPSMATTNSALVDRRVTPAAATTTDVASRAQPAAVQTQPLAPAGGGTSDGGGQYYAYMGSFGTRAAAESHWANLKQNHGSILMGVEPTFQKTGDLTSVAVGPFVRGVATEMCVRIRTDCYTAQTN